MDSLYSRLAAQWDRLFPPDPRREAFLAHLSRPFRPYARVIDVGCGTGATARFLAAEGHAVAASDLDPDMVRVAWEASDGTRATAPAAENPFPPAGTAHFAVADMVAALATAPASTTDVVLCLGNTLPHLATIADLRTFVRSSAATLRGEGVLVIQILNYTRILRNGRTELPDLKGDGLRFRRHQFYDSETKRIVFATEVRQSDRVEHRKHYLMPLDTAELDSIASEAGLGSAGLYGDWRGTPFRSENPWLVAIYRKPIR